MPRRTFSLKGKTALITGGAKRLGKACALALARQGAHLVIHYRTSEAEARDTAREIQALGVKAWTVQGDQGDRDRAGQIFDDAVHQAGPIDILINSASIFPKNRLDEFTWDDLESNIQINAFGPLVLARAFAAQQREGSLLNFLDSRMCDYDRDHAAYHLSKRMFFTLTRMMALEYAPRITVNAIAPGPVLPPPGESQDYLERMAQFNPMRSHGGPEDIADAAVFLLRSRFITGQILFVDGGRHMHGQVYGM